MAVVTTIQNLRNHVGQSVTLRGWVYSKRSSGKIRFLNVRDGSGTVQVVWVQGQVAPDVFDGVDKLTQESSLLLTGKVREEKRAKGGFELDGESIELIQLVQDYPIGPKEHGPDFLLGMDVAKHAVGDPERPSPEPETDEDQE